MPKPKRPPSSKQKNSAAPGELSDRRRLDLLEAAYALTAEKGLAGLRTRDVAARAKVNISTLHYYFGTKEALITALVEYTTSKFNRGERPHQGPADDPLQAHFLDTWRIFQETPQLSLVLEELSMRSTRDPETRAAFRAVHERWNAGVEQLLRGLAAAGYLRPGIDPKLGAFILSSFVIGASVELRVNRAAFDFVAVARELSRWASPSPSKPADK